MTIHAKWCGWEGEAGAQWGGGTAGFSAQAAAARTGNFGLQLLAAASAPNGEFQLAPTMVHVLVEQTWFHFPTSLPATDIHFMQWRSSGSTVTGYRLIFDVATATIRLAHFDSGGLVQETEVGPVIEADRWYRLDVAVYGSSSSPGRQMRWAIDGVEQAMLGPDATYISGVLQSRKGFTSSQTYTAFMDDVTLIWTGAGGDEATVEALFPLDPIGVHGLPVVGVGTHVDTGSFGASTGTLADSWQLLDSTPINTGTEYVEQIVNAITEYLEYVFAPLPAGITDSDIVGIQAYTVEESSGLNANNIQFHIIDGVLDHTLLNEAWLDISSPWTINEDESVAPLVAGGDEFVADGWTVARVNALLARWGYSSDVVSIPRLPALMLEVAAYDDIATDIIPGGSWWWERRRREGDRQ